MNIVTPAIFQLREKAVHGSEIKTRKKHSNEYKKAKAKRNTDLAKTSFADDLEHRKIGNRGLEKISFFHHIPITTHTFLFSLSPRSNRFSPSFSARGSSTSRTSSDWCRTWPRP
jgi:hypothetical protein